MFVCLFVFLFVMVPSFTRVHIWVTPFTCRDHIRSIYSGVIAHFATHVMRPLLLSYIYGYSTVMILKFFSNNFISFSFHSPVVCSRVFVWVGSKNELQGPCFNLSSIPEQKIKTTAIRGQYPIITDLNTSQY